MANTINLGNGEWATKDGNLLAYNDENGNFKPIDLDFTRASTATNVNRLGLLETARTSEPRIDFSDNPNGSLLLEPQSTNLITYPRSFGNSYWTKSGANIQGDASTVGVEKITNGTFTGGIAGWTLQPNWAYGADNIVSDGSGASALAFQNSILTAGLNYKITFEITAYTSGVLRLRDNSVLLPYNYNSLGLHTLHLHATETGFFGFQNYSAFIGSIDNVSIKEVQGFASPHVDYPTGAFKLVQNTNTGYHYIQQTLNLTGSYVYSIYLKKGEYDSISLYMPHPVSGSNTLSTFNLSIGGFTTNNHEGVSINLVSDWYRISLKTKLTGSHNILLYVNQTIQQSETGDGTSGIYIFGAQLEQQSSATSLILGATEGSTVTRIQDTASKSGLSSLIGQTEGTLFVETKVLFNGTYTGVSLSDNSSNNEVYFRFTNQNEIQFYMRSNNVQIIGYTATSFSTDDYVKIGFSYKSGETLIYVNGALVLNSPATVMPLVLNTLKFSKGNSTGVYVGNTKNLQVYNTALTDAELITLTTI